MKKPQTDAEGLEVEKAVAVAREGTKVIRRETKINIQRSRRNLERSVKYKRMTGTVIVLSLCFICINVSVRFADGGKQYCHGLHAGSSP
ncbi:MAG TPA: hypothetical protein VK487_02465 [Candidatus Bathyarchaeia archaeon]|nr:hypothetical protein [Candidatus Bathyarchaeia archaeon]